MTKSTIEHPHERNKSMLHKRSAFSGISVDDIQKAKECHNRILRLEAKRDV
jgi:hypothetical protein